MSMNSMGLGIQLFAEDAMSGPIDKAGKALGGLDKSVKQSQVSMKEVGAEMRHVGERMMMAGAAGIAGLGAAAMASEAFSRKIAEVATEADLSIFPQEKMKDIAKDMALQFGKMPTEQAEAMYDAVAFGANDAAKATDLMSAANKLAVAGVTDVKSAVDALAGTARAYNVGFEKSADISDTFFKAMTMGKMKVGELAHAMPKATGIAASLGISYDQLAGSIALLTSRGVQADEAVTGIKAALTNIIKPSSDASAEAAKLGIKFDQATLRAKGWPEFLRSIVTNGKYSKETLSKLFGSVEGANAVLQMVGTGMGDMDAMMKAMGDRAGATQAGFEVMAQESGFAFDQLKAQAMVALINIGDVVKPVLGIVLRFASAVVQGFNALPGPVRTAIVGFFGIVSVFLVVAGAAIALVGAVLAIAAAGEAVAIAIAASAVIVEYLAVAFALVGAAAFVAKKAFDENLGGIGDFVQAQVAKVTLAWNAVSQLFSSGEFSGAVMAELNKAGNEGIKDFAIQLFMYGARVKNFLAGFADGFNAGFSGLAPVFGELKDALVRLFALFGMAKDGPDQAAASFASWGSAGVSVGQMLAQAVGAVVSAIAWVVNISAAMGEGFQAAWSPLSRLVATAQLFATAFAPLGPVLAQIGIGFGGAGGGMATFATGLGFVIGIVSTVVQVMAGQLSAAIGVVTAIVSGFIGVFSGIANVVSGVVNIVVGLLSGNWDQAFAGAKQVVFGAVQAIVSYLGILVSAVAGVMDGIGRMFGKDLGLQKSFEGFKADSLKALALELSLEKRAEVTGGAVAKAAPQTPPPTAPGNVPGAPPTTAPGAPAPPLPAAAPPPPVGNAAPAAAAAASAPDIGATVASAIRSTPQPPINIASQTTLTVDGQVLADIVDQHSTAGAARGNK